MDDFSPATAAELARFVEQNAAGDRRPLLPVGGPTALRFGQPVAADSVSVSMVDLARVIDYPARDMTLTVEAGIRIEELQRLLAGEGQRLPIDIPEPHRATLGGALATNTCGPARLGCGGFRDYVIGITAVDGRGRLFSAGGRVVKNVAGYDLCKLLVGSAGTLAIVTQVTLKLRPRPESRRILWTGAANVDAVEAALETLTRTGARPIAVEVLNEKAARQVRAESAQELPAAPYVLILAVEGTAAETAWQVDTLRRELGTPLGSDAVALTDDPGDAVWNALGGYQSASDDPLTFQASLPPSRLAAWLTQATALDVAVQAHAGNGVAVGHLPDRCSTPQTALAALRPLRNFARAQGGSLTVLACDDGWKHEIAVFDEPHASWRLMAGIKRELDPHNVLSRGRLPFGGDHSA